jgi:hypothetical protein
MGTPISTLPLAELAAMYSNASMLRSRIKAKPQLYRYNLTALEVDMELLYAAMVPKIPDSHLLEVVKLVNQTYK